MTLKIWIIFVAPKLLYKHLSGHQNLFSLLSAFRMTKLAIFMCFMSCSLIRAEDKGKYFHSLIIVGTRWTRLKTYRKTIRPFSFFDQEKNFETYKCLFFAGTICFLSNLSFLFNTWLRSKVFSLKRHRIKLLALKDSCLVG